ncbi:hypothetical protein KTH_56300 [Thermosporothrix hazakensis]|nr:hypothetical protein KTH_47750 [Thermosporothrix hazakensis]GCE50761.1 hypothetical protein KTH_56300 [Thermosporothrix hazakensis]
MGEYLVASMLLRDWTRSLVVREDRSSSKNAILTASDEKPILLMRMESPKLEGKSLRAVYLLPT